MFDRQRLASLIESYDLSGILEFLHRNLPRMDIQDKYIVFEFLKGAPISDDTSVSWSRGKSKLVKTVIDSIQDYMPDKRDNPYWAKNPKHEELYDVIRIPKGTTLYHGTPILDKKKFVIPREPAFFGLSPNISIAIIAEKISKVELMLGRVIEYTTIKDIDVISATEANIFGELFGWHGENEYEHEYENFCSWLQGRDVSGVLGKTAALAWDVDLYAEFPYEEDYDFKDYDRINAEVDALELVLCNPDKYVKPVKEYIIDVDEIAKMTLSAANKNMQTHGSASIFDIYDENLLSKITKRIEEI